MAVALFGLLTATGAIADGTTKPTKVDVRNLCAAIAKYDNTQNSDAFIHFFVTLKPQLDTPEGRKALDEIYQLAMTGYADNGGNPSGDDLLGQLLEWLKQNGYDFNFQELQQLIEKSIPYTCFR